MRERLKIERVKLRRTLGRLRTVADVALRTGANPASKAKLLLGGIGLLLTNDLKTTAAFTARLRQFGQTADFRFESLDDVGVFGEVFVEEEYAVDLAEEPRIIFDLGSNVGVSLLYFRLRYPNARLYGFEPDPSNFRRLQRAMRAFPGVALENVAVWSANGHVDFFAADRGASSSVMRRDEGQQQTRVRAETLRAIMDKAGVDQVDLLKFDVEGAETEIFKCPEDVARITDLVGEVHADLGGGVEDVAKRLEKTHHVEMRLLQPQRYLLRATRRSGPP